MAQLKDLLVNGATRLIGDVFTNKIQITAVNAPTASNSTTYGPGTSGQVLKSNGTSVYWAADDNSQTVTGVKGNSESSYRTGNVNITAANIGLGNVENTKLSTWAGSANITTIGTISSGTWNGTAITATYGGTGKTNLKDAANALINALDTGSSNLTANDYVITQYAGGGTTTTTYHRRPASALRVGGVLVTSTDEGIARYNGTTGALQNTSQITINDNGLLTATHTSGKTDGIAIKYGSTIDYFLGVGTANVNHGLYDNKASKWVLSAGADNIWSLNGNAETATTATNLASAPSLATSGTTQITVTAGGKTSDAFTVPYATSAGSATKATQDGSGNNIVNTYLTKAAGVTNVAWDSTNKKLTKTINDTTSDVVTIGTIKTALSLAKADVGLGNVENKSSATIRGELTSSNVTTALGFTPYNATNPNGYTTNTGTVTKVTAGTGLNTSADQADSATKGSITTTGTLYLTKSGVTAGSYGPSAAVTGNEGTTMNVPYITVDAYGRVTSISNKVYTAKNTTYTFTAGTSTLAWNSEVTLATVGGLAIKAKLPANPNTNTDTLVKQTAKTDNVEYKILSTTSASPTSGNAAEAAYGADFTINPSAKTITSPNYKVTANATITYNTTNGCLEIIV